MRLLVFLAISLLISAAAAFSGYKEDDLNICHYTYEGSNIMVNCSYRNLQECPSFLPNISNMTSLDLSHNNISSIPSLLFFGKNRLRTLDLSHNEITCLPCDLVFNKPQLTTLMFSFNKNLLLLNTLSHVLPNLTLLGLSKTGLTSINPASFGSLKVVRYLLLSQNNITELQPDLFSNLQIDYALDLSRNNISNIHQQSFGNGSLQHKLKILLLQRNNLTVIYNNTFDYLQNLRYLCLFNNRISTLQNFAFVGLKNISIFLFGNNLTHLNGSPFPKSARELYLHDNKIKNLSGTIFDGLLQAEIVLNCEFLDTLPLIDNKKIHIICSNELLPTIKLDASDLRSYNTPKEIDILDILKKEGFNCSNSSCTTCSKGFYADGKQGCQQCPEGGFYQDDFGVSARNPGEIACKVCNSGTWVSNGAGVSSDQCEVCPEGTDKSRPASYRACFCKVNHTRTHRFGKCFPCDNNIYNCSHDVKLPLPGYFWSWEFANASRSNYRHFVINMKKLDHSFKGTSNSYDGIIPKAFPCLRKRSCINDGFQNVTTRCEKGYKGWLCAKCQNNYYGALNLCVPCPKKIMLIAMTSVFVFLCVSLLLLLSWQFEKERKNTTKKRSVVNVLISRTKILLGFYQIVGKLLESLHDVSWADPLVPLGTVISLMELNIIRDVSGARCLFENLELNPEGRFVIGIIMPIFIICSASLIYQAKRAYLKYNYLPSETQLVSTKLRKLKDRLLTYVTVLFFCMYPGISTVIFNMYPSACQEFPLHDNATENETRRLLRSDYGIDCKTSAFHSYNIAAYCFTLLYVIAFPATLFCFLWKHCSRWSTQRRLTDDNNSTEAEESGTEEDMPLVVDYSDVPPAFPTWLNFLCENYKSQFWYWEILELIRKCSQTILLTIYGWDYRIVPLTICVSVLFLTLHARYMPMKCPYDQRLQLFSLAVIFTNVVIMSIKTDVRKKHNQGGILIILNIAVLLLIVGELVFRTIVNIKKRFPKKVTLFFSAGWYYLFHRRYRRRGENIV
ncbi:uncharacterized protein [Apostichopus japonicus]|uniref:uncharacterized protein isoform X1 n=1 Tax=Stichopus japonicus TaxID=307972 RepID=UPI003AB63FCF